MYEYIIFFTAAFMLAFALEPLVMKLAFATGVIDIPKDNRRMHNKPIPLMGGLAIFAAFLVTCLAGVICSGNGILEQFQPNMTLWGIIGGAVVIEIIGILDDIFTLTYKPRLPVQILAALIVAATGTRITYVTNPFVDAGYSVLPAPISWILTVLWIVGLTNALNLIDGLDGLSG